MQLQLDLTRIVATRLTVSQNWQNQLTALR